MNKLFSKLIIFALVGQMLFVFNAFGRHTYHTSLTRIDHNQTENLLEISIKVFAHDLLPALEKKVGKRVDLENTKNIDQILESYLAEKFVFKTKAGEKKSFRWVGKELETDVVMLYIEIPFTGELEGAEIKNTLFFEKFREQINLIHLEYGDKKSDLVYQVGDGFKTIKENSNS